MAYLRRSLHLKRPDIEQAFQAGSFLLCAFLALQITRGLDGTEFSGGWLTGPLLSMADIGTLFVLALVLTFSFPRVAAAIGLASSSLCFPLYCFFIAPVLFAQIFAGGHEFKVQPAPGFHWDTWPATALVGVAVAIYACIRCLSPSRRMQIPQRAQTHSPS
jgi:hypothetical protein